MFTHKEIHISSCWVEISLDTKFLFPMLPRGCRFMVVDSKNKGMKQYKHPNNCSFITSLRRGSGWDLDWAHQQEAQSTVLGKASGQDM